MKIKFHIFHNLCFLLLLSSLNCHFLLLVFLSFYQNGPQLEIDKVVFLVVLFAPPNRLTLALGYPGPSRVPAGVTLVAVLLWGPGPPAPVTRSILTTREGGSGFLVSLPLCILCHHQPSDPPKLVLTFIF